MIEHEYMYDLFIFRRTEHMQETTKLKSNIDTLKRELNSLKTKTAEDVNTISERDARIRDLELQLSELNNQVQQLNTKLDESSSEFQNQSQLQNEVVQQMELRIQAEEAKSLKLLNQREKWKKKAFELDAELIDVKANLSSVEQKNSTLVQNLNHATIQLQDLRSQHIFQQSIVRAGIYQSPEVSYDIKT